jgi:hypothetical protein
MHAVGLRFGLPARRPAALAALIKTTDRMAAYLEATRLAGFSDREARRFFGGPPRLDAAALKLYLSSWSAETAERRFLKRFSELEKGSA